MASSTGGKGNRKKGRNAVTCARYKSENRREHNKLRRILRNNGREYAEKWCERFDVPKSWIPS